MLNVSLRPADCLLIYRIEVKAQHSQFGGQARFSDQLKKQKQKQRIVISPIGFGPMASRCQRRAQVAFASASEDVSWTRCFVREAELPFGGESWGRQTGLPVGAPLPMATPGSLARCLPARAGTVPFLRATDCFCQGCQRSILKIDIHF